MIRTAALAVALVVVAACASTPPAPAVDPTPTDRAPPTPAPPSAPAKNAALTGMDAAALIGASAQALVDRFGEPSLRRREGLGLVWTWTDPDCGLAVVLADDGGGLSAIAARRTPSPGGPGCG